jgi:hypothetical protein
MKKNNILTDLPLKLNGNFLSLKEHQHTIPMELLTINKVFELFPEVKNTFNWSKEDFVDLFEGKLLIGKVDDEGELLISKESLVRLIEYRKNVK